MTRQFHGSRLVLASHNPGKVDEIRALLAPYGIEPMGAAALGLPEPEETEQVRIHPMFRLAVSRR